MVPKPISIGGMRFVCVQASFDFLMRTIAEQCSKRAKSFLDMVDICNSRSSLQWALWFDVM